jgi:hypothetical protein
MLCIQSTVTVDRSVLELKELMTDLPDYADQFLNMICTVLRGYRDTCHNAYRGTFSTHSSFIIGSKKEDHKIGTKCNCNLIITFSQVIAPGLVCSLLKWSAVLLLS